MNGINTAYLQSFSVKIIVAINAFVIPVLFAVAFLTFLWGVYRYLILGADSEDKRKEGKVFVFWGIIGFVVIISLWGLVAMVGNTLGLTAGGSAPAYPTL